MSSCSIYMPRQGENSFATLQYFLKKWNILFGSTVTDEVWLSRTKYSTLLKKKLLLWVQKIILDFLINDLRFVL